MLIINIQIFFQRILYISYLSVINDNCNIPKIEYDTSKMLEISLIQWNPVN